MAINPISVATTTFKGKPTREELLALANADDKTLKSIATQAAVRSPKAEQHRKASNRLFYSIPIASGLAAVVDNPTIGKFARLGNLAKFGAAAGSLIGAIAVFDLVGLGVSKAYKSSDKLKEFAQKHPVIATLGSISAGVGAVILSSMGMGKLAGKFANSSMIKKTLSPKNLRRFIKLNNAIQGSKVLNKASSLIDKMPKTAKNITKGIISGSPFILLVGSLIQSGKQANAQRNASFEIYSKLKDDQKLAQAELEKIQNIDDVE